MAQTCFDFLRRDEARREKESWSHRTSLARLILINIIIILYLSCMHQVSHRALCTFLTHFARSCNKNTRENRLKIFQARACVRSHTNYLWMHNNSQSHHHRLKDQSHLVNWFDHKPKTKTQCSIFKAVYDSFKKKSFLSFFSLSLSRNLRILYRRAINVNSWWVKLQFNATGHNHIQHVMYSI